jgi:hypothetical protein
MAGNMRQDEAPECGGGRPCGVRNPQGLMLHLKLLPNSARTPSAQEGQREVALASTHSCSLEVCNKWTTHPAREASLHCSRQDRPETGQRVALDL